MTLKNFSTSFSFLFTFFFVFTSTVPNGLLAQIPLLEPYVRYSEPTFITYDELKQLSENPQPKGALKRKLEKFWKTPLISNEAYYSGVRPTKHSNSQLGEFMRVATWNIEKSMAVDDAIELLNAPKTKLNMLIDHKAAPIGSKKHELILHQRERLKTADIILLQEMEIGIKRSKYKNATAELGKALNMNYAFGAQYLEVDPVMLGLEELEFEEDDAMEIREDIREYYNIDPTQYKGVFGSGILSKYPIKKVTLVPLKTKPYDWYTDENVKVAATEKLRRVGAKVLFKNAIQRELKVGNRHFFRIDLDVPDLPNETLTIVNIHLEIKCQPKDRKAQMEEILGYIRNIDNPVIVMGDFNMSATDISPTTAARVLRRTAKNPTTWLSLGINVISPHSMVINTTRGISNITKNFNDPTAKHVPVVAPNPMRPFFDMMEEFRFQDGTVFDFRGDKDRSTGGKTKKLANANQRGKKGFKTSFRVIRPLGLVGKYRLDWVFVKSFARSHDPSSSYKFAPHFGETLEELNFDLKEPISDHAPLVVDLPFAEPRIS